MATRDMSLDSLFGVRGLTVVVTGGGTGIGKAITTAFVQNGAKVLIVGRRLDVLERARGELGESVVPIQGDLGTRDSVETIAKRIREQTGVVDTLVNCAGIAIPLRDPGNPDPAYQYYDREFTRDSVDLGRRADPTADTIQGVLAQVQDNDWQLSQAINVNGPFYLSTMLVPLLLKSSNPNVVNFSSVAGMANQRANNHFVYGVTKAAMIHMSSMLAGRLHPLKIRVNCICPGIFPTEMTAQVGGDGSLSMGAGGVKAGMRSTIGRPGRPEEIAAPVLLLASKGGRYMNNMTMNIDGGRLLVMSGIYDGIHLAPETYVA